MVQKLSKNEKIKILSIWEKFSISAEEHQINISKAKDLPSQILGALIDNKSLHEILILFGELYWRMSDDKLWFKCFEKYLKNWEDKNRN